MDPAEPPQAASDAPEQPEEHPGAAAPVELAQYRLTISTYGRRAGDVVLMDPELPWVSEALAARWLEPL